MSDLSTDRLGGVVLRFVNIAALLPRYKGHIGLEVRIERGRLRPGQKIKLSGPEVTTEIEVAGIEVSHDPKEPKVIRVLCSSPAGLSFPDGDVEGWTILNK
jgi:hypothetical protein